MFLDPPSTDERDVSFEMSPSPLKQPHTSLTFPAELEAPSLSSLKSSVQGVLDFSPLSASQDELSSIRQLWKRQNRPRI